METIYTAAQRYHRAYPNQRLGQVYFNVAWEADPDFANNCGIDTDCFQDDSKIGPFLVAWEARRANDEAKDLVKVTNLLEQVAPVDPYPNRQYS